MKRKKVKKVKKIKKKKKTIVKSSFSQPAGQNTYKSKNFKANEIKIKKIVKQPTEKRTYNVKDYVVFPHHVLGKLHNLLRYKFFFP